MKKAGAPPPASTKSIYPDILMPTDTSITPQGNDNDPDDDIICGACGARYLPDRFALECEVCAAEDHTFEVEF